MKLGIDIGGTNVRVAHVDAAGRVVASERRALTDRTPAGVINDVVALTTKVGRADLTAAGVGFAGMLRGSIVVNAPNLGWRDVDFGSQLQNALGLPTRLVNDLSAAAWGEKVAGAAKGASNTFTVFVGTGVGSAIIANDALLTGATGVAAEFGHLKIVAEAGRLCGCGENGCLEAYAGGAKLTEWMAERGVKGGPSELEAAALAGPGEARTLYDFAVGHLALAIANQVTVLNPAVLVLGGGVLSHCPGMVQRIIETVGARSSKASRDGLRIQMAALGDDSGIIGAALLA